MNTARKLIGADLEAGLERWTEHHNGVVFEFEVRTEETQYGLFCYHVQAKVNGFFKGFVSVAPTEQAVQAKVNEIVSEHTSRE